MGERKLLMRELQEKVGKYYRAVREKSSDDIIAVHFSTPEEFMAAVLAIFLCDKKVYIYKKVHISRFLSIDLLFTDSKEETGEFRGNICTPGDVHILDAPVYEGEFSVGDVILEDGITEYGIEGNIIKKWIQNEYGAQFEPEKSAYYIYNSIFDFYNFMWLLPVLQNRTLYYEKEVPTKIDKDNSLFILPISKMKSIQETMTGFKEGTKYISYGDEMYEQDIMLRKIKKKNSTWVNYFGFPYIVCASSVKVHLINGKIKPYQLLVPVEGISLDSRFDYYYKGNKNEDGTIKLLGYADNVVYSNGHYISKEDIVSLCSACEYFVDYWVADDRVYYCCDHNKSVFDIERYFYKAIPEQYVKLNLIEVPNIEYIHKKTTEKMLGSIEIAEIYRHLSEEKFSCAIRVEYENDGGTILFDQDLNKLNLPIHKINQDNEVGSSLAFIDGGAIEKNYFFHKNLCELLHERRNSRQSLLFYTENGLIKETYSEMYYNAVELASGLKDIGMKQGDKLIFQLPRRKEFVECFWACMLLGVVPAPLAVLDDFGNKNMNTNKLINIWDLLDKPNIITSTGLIESFKKLKSTGFLIDEMQFLEVEKLYGTQRELDIYNWENDETCLILFTSGSTGIPKGVQLTNGNIFSRTIGEIQLYHLDDNNVDINWMTLTHAAGLIWSHIRDVFMDIFQVQIDTEVILKDPLKLLEIANEYNGTITWAPNFAYSLIGNALDNTMDYRWNLEKFRYIFSAGEANISKTLRHFLRGLEKYNLPSNAVIPSFGMTETSSCITYYNQYSYNSSSDTDKFLPVGEPMPGIQIKIINENGKICKTKEVGRVLGRGSTFTKGYYKNSKANQESFTKDGFLITGDMGYIEDGQLVLTGRANDLIIVNGLNYYVQDIESIIDEMKEVAYCAATSVIGDDGTDKVLLVFAPQEDGLLDENRREELKELVDKVRSAVRKEYKLNINYVVPVNINTVPRTEIGKKQRIVFRQAFYAGDYNSTIQKLMNESNQEGVLLSGAWIRANDAIGILPENNVKLCIISNQTIIENKISSSWPGKVEFIALETITQLESGYIIDSFAYDNKDELEEFSTKLLKHSKLWAACKNNTCIYIPVSYGCGFDGDKIFNTNASLLLGLIKSMILEYPDILLKLVDLDDSSMNGMIKEIVLGTRDEYTVYRKNERYRYMLKSLKDKDKNSDFSFINKNAVILGGLGGVGYELVKYLIVKYDIDAILLGSKPLTGLKERRFNEIKNIKSTIKYKQIDITKAEEVEQIISQYEDEVHKKVNLFFHLAGKISENASFKSHWDELGSHIIKNETNYSFYETIKSKVVGISVLESLRSSRKDAYLILFSSVNGFFGGNSLGAYSAANSMMDAYGRWRSQTDSKIYTINWSQWIDTGITSEIPEIIKKTAARSGFIPASIEKNLQYFDYIIKADIKNTYVGIDRTYKKNYAILADDYKQKLCIYHTQDDNAVAKMLIQQHLEEDIKLEMNYVYSIPRLSNQENDIDWNTLEFNSKLYNINRNEGGISHIEQQMLQIWTKVLKIQNIGLDDDFFDCGGDSVRAAKLQFYIAEEFDVEMSFGDVLECNTPRKCIEQIGKLTVSK